MFLMTSIDSTSCKEVGFARISYVGFEYVSCELAQM